MSPSSLVFIVYKFTWNILHAEVELLISVPREEWRSEDPNQELKEKAKETEPNFCTFLLHKDAAAFLYAFDMYYR